MTVSAQHTVARYTGDGVQTQWPVPFPFFQPEDVKARLGARDLLYGADYSVSAAQGGTLHCAVPAGATLTLWLELPIVQEMDLTGSGRLSPEDLEKGLDYHCLVARQLDERLSRAVTVPLEGQQSPEDLCAELFQSRDDAAHSAQQAAHSAQESAASAQKAEHALAQTIDAKAVALREIREHTDGQIERVTTTADQLILAADREANRAHDQADRARQEADRARDEADRAAITATVAVGVENLEAAWVLDRDMVAGDVLALPEGILYFPGRHMLRLGFEGLECYPGLQFEEVVTTRAVSDCPATPEKDICPAGKVVEHPELPSNTVRLLFDVAKGSVCHVWVVASNVARHVEASEEHAKEEADKAEDAADRACACADASCACAAEAEQAKDTAVNAAQDAQDSADRADDAAHDAEQAANAAHLAHCKQGIASLLNAALLQKPLPNGFYALNPHMALPATCSLPLFPVRDLAAVPGAVDGFYLFAPHDPNCDPSDPGDGPDPDDPDTPGNPGGGLLPCGRRASLLHQR